MVEVVAGRRYVVISPNGEREEGVATPLALANGFDVAGRAMDSRGWIAGGNPAIHVLRVEEIGDGATSVEPETLDERHAADMADLGAGSLPRLDARRLELRRLHALERIADALETLTCVAIDAQEHAAGGRDEDATDGESVQ